MLRFFLSNNDQHETQGASQEFISSLMSQARAPTESEQECACSICIEQFEPGSSIVQLECSHTFHAACIRRWFSSNTTCPVCRHETPSDEHEHEHQRPSMRNVLFFSPTESSIQWYTIHIAYPNRIQQSTTWAPSHTVVDLFLYIQRMCAQPNANIQLQIGSYIFKTSESYNVLNVALSDLDISETTHAKVSLF